MIPREMAQGLRDLVGRAMVDPDFLVALQRSPNALLADYELTADERWDLTSSAGVPLQDEIRNRAEALAHAISAPERAAS